jgi:hypothetical protein
MDNTTVIKTIMDEDWFENELENGLRYWQIIFLACSCLLSVGELLATIAG